VARKKKPKPFVNQFASHKALKLGWGAEWQMEAPHGKTTNWNPKKFETIGNVFAF